MRDRTQLSLDLSISDDTGLIAAVELNMGAPGQHLYALIGRVLAGMNDPIKMLILVLLTSQAKDYAFLNRIRSVNSRPRFGVILGEMPIISEPAFAEATAKEILNLIKSTS